MLPFPMWKMVLPAHKEVPKEKLINSVPFYTRVWTEKDGKTTSKAYGMTAAKKWVDENNVELTWQDKVGQYYGEIENENGVQKIWMEEAKSLGLKKTWSISMTWRELPAGSWDLRQRISGRLWMK